MATEITVAENEQHSDTRRALTPAEQTFSLNQRQARMFASSPLVPQHLRNGDEQQAVANCWIALKMAEAMGEQPLTVMQNIHIVQGKAGFAAQYMIARANAAGVFKGRIDWEIDKSDPDNLSVTAFGILKDTEKRVEFTCDMNMARAENWTKNPKYKSMPELMLRYRSATFLVRFYAPDVMLGYQTIEEVEDVVLAAPATAPLTAEMIADQSQPQAPAETVDEETGEILQAESDQDAEPEDGQDDDAHPAGDKADEIILAVRKCETIIDLNALAKENETDIASMPEGIADSVQRAIANRRKALTKKGEPADA